MKVVWAPLAETQARGAVDETQIVILTVRHARREWDSTEVGGS